MAQATIRVKLIAAVLSPLLFLLLLEGGLRIAGFRYSPQAGKNPQETARRLYATDRELIWKLLPSAVIRDSAEGFEDVHTNSLGLRGGELPSRRTEGELRILCLGDSVTFGLGAPDDLTWPALLEDDLRNGPGMPGRRVRVVNGAVPGWSSVQGMRLLGRLSWFDPDVVVFWYGMNDVQDAEGGPDSRRGGQSGGGLGAFEGLRTVHLLRRAADAARGLGDRRPRVSAAEYRAAIGELRGREEKGGPKVVFVRYPHRLDRTTEQLRRVVARAGEEGVERVAGPEDLLSPITPAPPDTDLIGTVVVGPEGKELRFGSSPASRVPVRLIRAGFEQVDRWRRGLEERLALLPADAVRAEEMFGDAPEGDVFTDNVHLTVEGNRRAARAIAARIAALFR